MCELLTVEKIKQELSERCELREGYSWNAEDDPYYQIPFTTCGDYTGSLVELANLKVLQDRFRFVSVQHWPYHTETGVIYFSDLESIAENPEEFQDFLEALDALADYPLLDDEEWSLQENEAIEEAWDNWFGSDFSSSLCDIVRREEKLLHGKNKRKHISRKKALEKLEDKINDLETDQLKEMCRKLEDKTCTYWENESGNSMYISLKRLLTPVRVKFRTIPIKGKYTVTATLVY